MTERLVKLTRELPTYRHAELLELKKTIEIEISYRQTSQDPTAYGCPSCGWTHDEYYKVMDHMQTTHGFSHHEIVRKMERMYP